MGPSYVTEDYVPFRIMSGILGGGIGSRLGKNVRETQGLAYMVGAWLEGARSGSVTGNRFTGFLSTGSPLAERALSAMAEELNRIADEGVEEEELLLEQSRTIGQNAISYDSYDPRQGTSPTARSWDPPGQRPDHPFRRSPGLHRNLSGRWLQSTSPRTGSWWLPGSGREPPATGIAKERTGRYGKACTALFYFTTISYAIYLSNLRMASAPTVTPASLDQVEKPPSLVTLRA